MKKLFDPYFLILFSLIALVFTSAAQKPVKWDTVIDMGIYKSYFNKTLKQPVAITYTLSKGGGSFKRDNDHFVGTAITHHNKDYEGKGFDRGHLVPAEDFAFSDSLQALTFSYYNCIPQTPELNRGKWKYFETVTRKLSQKEPVQIVCYISYTEKKVGELAIPDVCYKAVFDMTGRLLLEIGFEDTADCRSVPVTFEVGEVMYVLLIKN